MRLLILSTLLGVALLAGCGQKGPLFLPPETPPGLAGTP
ncbi:MAG: lipopeptide [Pseudomonadales bacterium]|nr:lipopeptide [Pseudomonadales bacterium]MBP9034064.1 lipopeptide [Pseudomonadales bacterium]